MTLIRWQPFQEIETLRRQMDQVFEELASNNQQPETFWKPAVELKDTEDSLILRAEIPGVEGKDLDVQVTREAVAIRGEYRREQQAQERGLFRSEFRYGKFQRVVGLPVAVQNDQVQAEFKNGILTLTLPKVTEARRKVVKVNIADTSTATPAIASEQSDNNNQADKPEAEPASVW
ncbi:Hsp20/alpha crystallin family protein [Gloeocapsopsis crepidinum LEGE 06123]|uniref:Hsp20/alpha crystallin family protein n=1 Tax=Gloeocapsopsis crepidinum LEGE 06123 TaxID=588587 RepID=A0ABR9UKU7_9CHRO|nr:Hsp20/alpha crystallin family protein [Gloeocapsopsis crepidinum]MBE9188916.1 Hsp20/alpha crystallin family protein [Gloeocapsopsis crepidinum LEGE 06123]